MVGSKGWPRPGTDLRRIMAYQDWELSVARIIAFDSFLVAMLPRSPGLRSLPEYRFAIRESAQTARNRLLEIEYAATTGRWPGPEQLATIPVFRKRLRVTRIFFFSQVRNEQSGQ